uniref:Secreted protein n=1 Tax=Ditylenchus dipsaci TaxID=166011 RepID=A0A915ECX4_9BILA
MSCKLVLLVALFGISLISAQPGSRRRKSRHESSSRQRKQKTASGMGVRQRGQGMDGVNNKEAAKVGAEDQVWAVDKKEKAKEVVVHG